MAASQSPGVAFERAAYLLNEGWRKRIFGLGDGSPEHARGAQHANLNHARHRYGLP